MHTELLVDTVRRSREEESLLRRRADELRKLEEAICDPKLSAIFIEEVAARERRANEFRALAEQCEQFLADKSLLSELRRHEIAPSPTLCGGALPVAPN